MNSPRIAVRIATERRRVAAGTRVRATLLFFAAVLALLVVAGARPRAALADEFDEREQQLKALGVDDGLRPRIHRAIGIGAHWLAETLESDGAARPPKAKHPTFVGTGPSVLATLALAHSRTSESVPLAKRSAQRLLVDDKSAASTIKSDTYMAGIAGLIAADPACEVPAGVARELALRIAGGQEVGSGRWGYSLAPVGATAAARGAPVVRSGRVNLSTTQFAVLGAFGLGRAGAPVPYEVWERHLRGLCKHQADDGSWSYSAGHARTGYANGTYMGLAGLLVAEDALRDRIRDVAELRAIESAKLLGMNALRRDVGAFVKHAKSVVSRAASGKLARVAGGKVARVAGAIGVDGYGMYALEKACIFAGLDKVDGESWYEAGARLLVAAQHEDGSWGDVVTTSFALLFLARSPERYRPNVVTVTEPPPRPTTVTEPAPKPTTPSGPAVPAPSAPAKPAPGEDPPRDR